MPVERVSSLATNACNHRVGAGDLVRRKLAVRQLRVSRAILLCLGYGLFSLFATWFPVVVSQYFIPAQLRSPPRRSGRAQVTHPAPNEPLRRRRQHYGFTASYRHAATLDTKPLAKTYSSGNRTRLSSNHFQSARALHFYRIGSVIHGNVACHKAGRDGGECPCSNANLCRYDV